MAVRRPTIAILGCLCGLLPLAAGADAAAGVAAGDAAQAGHSRLHELLARTLTVVRRDRPQWLVEQSQAAPDPAAPAGDSVAQLVVQQDRRDGPDMLTLRYPLLTRGALRAYAGAGLNRAVYFADAAGAPVMLTPRNRESSIGAAAEFGAELQLSGQLLLSADLRWTDLDAAAVLLRADQGYVGADPVSVVMSVAWRFR
jgi:outer membrane protein W